MDDEIDLEALYKEAEGYKPYVPLRKRKKRTIGNEKNKTENTENNTNSKVTHKKLAPEAEKNNLEAAKEIVKKKKELKPPVRRNMGKYKTSWNPPSYISLFTNEHLTKLYKKFNLTVEGRDSPVLLTSFEEMRIPAYILKALRKNGILVPTQMQMQGIPSVLSGRDVIAVASPGSGKSLIFVLPVVLCSLEQELSIPFIEREGPHAMIIVPSRELAKQIYDDITYLVDAILRKKKKTIRVAKCIGGEPMIKNIALFNQGCHIVVGTPGRIIDLLKHNHMSANICRFLCIDEADRIVDEAFERELYKIMSYFENEFQAVLLTNTLPDKLKTFIEKSMAFPILIRFEKTASIFGNLKQDVLFVLEEDRPRMLLEVMQKTSPPVLIYCMKKSDVDYIHEYLLLKGVQATSVHADKSQTERQEAISDFKCAKKDVLVTTDLAAKGLDLPNVQHLVNYDVPYEISGYIKRMGRLAKKTSGTVTTLVVKSSEPVALFALKTLLEEGGQNVPDFLAQMQDPSTLKCTLCDSLEHQALQCPKYVLSFREKYKSLK